MILNSRDEEKGRGAAEEMEGDMRVQRLDVTDEKSVQNPARDVEESADTSVWAAMLPRIGGPGGVEPPGAP
jgi:hypothetical protein